MTLIPASTLIALALTALILPFGPDPYGAVVVSLLVVSPIELVAFAYDVVSKKNPILSCTFAPRLVLHVVGSMLALFVLATSAYIGGYLSI